MVDNAVMEVAALDPDDPRTYRARIAGPAALLVAKLHKISERATGSPHRLHDKDAHDIYRILIDVDTVELASSFNLLRRASVSSETTGQAVKHLVDLFATGPDALGASMAGRAEEGIGEPETVALSVSLLAADLIQALEHVR